MTITPISYQQNNAGTAKTDVAKTAFIKNFDTFLGILTTQLSNQNPLSPLDTHKFTEQLVQFASVEQQLAQRSALDRIEQAMTSNAASYAVNYLGTLIGKDGPQFETHGRGGEFSFRLPEATTRATVDILDENGSVVHTADISSRNDGRWYLYEWDGLLPPEEEGGLPMLVDANRVFTARIVAFDGAEQPVAAEVKGSRRVTAVDLAGGSPKLGFGDGAFIDMANIGRISF